LFLGVKSFFEVGIGSIGGGDDKHELIFVLFSWSEPIFDHCDFVYPWSEWQV